MARHNYGRLEGMAELERQSQKTIYKGQVMTVAQKQAMKAAETRKANAERKKKRGEYTREMILPSIRQQIEKTRKSTRGLKTIIAFVDNGPVQWSSDYKKMERMFPKIVYALSNYYQQYQKVMEIEKELDAVLRSSKTNKNFFGIADDFGYQMFNLLDRLEEVSKAISDSHVMDMPGFKNREIVTGAADGRRPGFKQILQNTTSNIMKTKQNLIELAKTLRQAYDDLVQYDSNGRQI